MLTFDFILLFDFVLIFNCVLTFSFSLFTNHDEKNNFNKNIFNTLFNSKLFAIDKVYITTRVTFDIFAKKVVYYRLIDFQSLSTFNIELFNVNKNNVIMNSTQIQRIINVVINSYIQQHSLVVDFSKVFEFSKLKSVNDLNNVNNSNNVTFC